MSNSKGKRNILKTLAIMTLSVMMLGICAFFYIQLVNQSLKEETLQSLSEVMRQGANTVERQMEGDLQTLRTISGMLTTSGKFDPEAYRTALRRQAQISNVKRMGIALLSGEATLTDSEQGINVATREYFKRALKGEPNISNALVDWVDGRIIYVYATPLYEGNEIRGVLFATSDALSYAASLNVRLFGGKGYSYITNRAGDVLIHPNHPDSVWKLDNIFDALEPNSERQAAQIAQMRDDMQNDRDGVIEYRRGGQRRYTSYMNIRVNDWYMVSAVSADVVAERLTYLSGLALLACVTGMLVVLGLCWYILHSKRQNLRELERLAYTDGVTGGYNWNGFQRAVRQVLARSGDTPYAMVTFDIDKFKVFNDLFGHDQGNRTMRNIWLALGEELDAEEPFARTSADHFNMLIRCTGQETVAERIERINRRVQQMHADITVKYALEFSFGVYPIEDKALSLNLMSDRAGLARKSIKGMHDQMIAFYDAQMREQIIEEKNIENEMVEALAGGQFEVYLQPKYLLSTRTIAGAEALVRWNHPERGLISPGMFIPLFERNGFIVELDEFVLDQVCRTLARWMRDGFAPVPVAVNISRLHLHDSTFTAHVEEIVERHGVPSRYIELELTESILLDFENIGSTEKMMLRLKEKGFSFALDDFGTGYSSLNLLRRLPVDVVKLDKEFFGQDDTGNRGRSVVSDVVALVKHLEMTVVAEGVETAEQVAFLSEIGCDIVQGYYFARPMTIGNFERLCWNRVTV